MSEINSRLVIMAASFLITVLSYVMVCRKDRSWINWATSSFAFSVAANYLLQALFLILGRQTDGSLTAYFYCYGSYAVLPLVSSLAYCFIRPPKLSFSSIGVAQSQSFMVRLLPWTILLVGVLLYLPVMIEFRAFLLSPRDIYTQTRSGYGVYTYGSTAAVSIAFILYLCAQRKRFVGQLIFYSMSFAIIYLHGSKGQLLILLFAWLIFRVYGQGKVLSAAKSAAVVVVMAVFVASSFFLFSTGIEVADLLGVMVGYSDYTRNAMMVVDDKDAKTYYGRLTIEDEIYSRIPRAIYPGKPHDFGSFTLDKTYFPESLYADVGAPAFGPGVVYADFGPFAILWTVGCAFVRGWLASWAVVVYRKTRHPSVMIVLMFFAGVSTISTGIAYALPETIAIAWLVSALMRVRLGRSILGGTQGFQSRLTVGGVST